jgi:tol-pal system protein YbgF
MLGLACTAGCATRADLLQVRQDQREVRALLADQQVAVEGLRRRIEILRNEMGESGKGRGGAAASSQVAQKLNDLEVRLAMLEQGRAPTPGAGLPPSGIEPPLEAMRPPEAPPPTPTVKAPSPQELALAKEEAALQGARVDNDYREALQLIREGQCNLAAPKLRDFVRKNPKSDLADNAQYWIGACYYGQRDYNRAIRELSDVMLKYSKGDKAPAALLMLAEAFADSGDKIDARLVLQKLISEHPRSEEAERGRQALKSLGE